MSACSEKKAISYSGADKLARALKANGVACENFVPTSGKGDDNPSPALKQGAKPLIKEGGDCAHGSSKLMLFIFRSRALRDRWLTFGRLYGSIVVGPNWAVSTQDKSLVDKISGAIGGEVK